jgi:hypothetical protein
VSQKYKLCLIVADTGTLSKFYTEALRYKLEDSPTGYKSWEVFLDEQGVPTRRAEPLKRDCRPGKKGAENLFSADRRAKSLEKNRLHIDINASAGLHVPFIERREQVNNEAA